MLCPSIVLIGPLKQIICGTNFPIFGNVRSGAETDTFGKTNYN